MSVEKRVGLVEFARLLLSQPLYPYQERLLREMEDAQNRGVRLILSPVMRPGRKTLERVVREYLIAHPISGNT